MKVKGRAIRSLVLAPFFNHKAISSRELLISDALTKFGSVDIVTTSFDHYTKSEKISHQFEDARTIYYLPTVQYKHNVSIARFISHFVFSLRSVFFYLKRKHEYDVVYVTLPLNLLALLVFVVRSEKLKVADVIDIWPDALPFSPFAKKILFPFFYFWKRSFISAIKDCDVLLTVSDWYMNESVCFFRHAPFAAQRFYLGCSQLPRKEKQKEERLTIVYIGNIGHLYDFETLLAALAARSDKTQFFLIGDGDRKEWLLGELERLKLEHQYFGVVYHGEQLAEILAHCDIGFNGYQNTTAAFSYKATTYFSAGLPILNSMSGDLRWLVTDRGLGFNFIQGNLTSLLGCIDQCSRDVMAVFAQNVEVFFREEIDQEIIKKKLTDFIGRFIANRYI